MDDEQGRIRTPISPATWTADEPPAEPDASAAEPDAKAAEPGPEGAAPADDASQAKPAARSVPKRPAAEK